MSRSKNPLTTNKRKILRYVRSNPHHTSAPETKSIPNEQTFIITVISVQLKIQIKKIKNRKEKKRNELCGSNKSQNLLSSPRSRSNRNKREQGS